MIKVKDFETGILSQIMLVNPTESHETSQFWNTGRLADVSFLNNAFLLPFS